MLLSELEGIDPVFILPHRKDLFHAVQLAARLEPAVTVMKAEEMWPGGVAVRIAFSNCQYLDAH